MKEHIVRMKIELEDLQNKINKLKDFLKNEQESQIKTNEQQRINIYCQLQHMEGYKQILEGRILYDTELENKKVDIKAEFPYEKCTSEEYVKQHEYNSWEDLQDSGDYHFENSLMDMKKWFFEEIDIYEIIDILEGKVSSSYNNFTYITDKNIWVFMYE